MVPVEELRSRLRTAEADLDARPSAVWAELSNCIESIVRAILVECFERLPDRNDVATLRKVELEIGKDQRSHHNFGLGDLVRMWRQSNIPRLWERLGRPTPAIFKSFAFDEFIEERNPGVHHARVPPIAKLKRLYYGTVELLEEAFPAEGWNQVQVQPGVPATPHNLPRLEQEFVGREAEVRRILEWLGGESRVWLVSITGVGGVGKSALAVEVARRCQGQGALPPGVAPESLSFDACVWTSAKKKELVGGQVRDRVTVTSNLETIVSEILRVAGSGAQTQEGSGRRQLQLAKDLLAAKRILLVVDNMETIDDDQVLAFLNELPQPSKAIVTDRRSVQASNAIHLAELTEDEAAHFVREQCAARGLHLDAEQVMALVNRTGGIPLAMIWAVGLMAQAEVGPEAVFRRLVNAGSRPLLGFMFGESFRVASVNAQRMLAACSLPGCPVRGAQMADWIGLGTADAEDALGELRSAALLRSVGEDGVARPTLDRRFDVLPLTRDFLRNEHPECVGDSLRERVARRVVGALLEREPRPSWPSIATIDAVEDQRHLLAWAMEDAFGRHDDRTVLDGLTVVGYALGIRGFHLQRLQLAELALRASERLGDARMEAHCLILNIAWVRFVWYEFDESERAALRGLSAARRASDRSLEGSAVRLLGLIAKERADRLPRDQAAERSRLQGEASAKLEEARNIFQVLGDKHMLAITLGATGSLLRDLDRLAEAESQMLQGREIARQLEGAEEIHSIMCQKLARLLAAVEGRLDDADGYNREAMTVLGRLRRPVGVAHCKLNQALIEERRGDLTAAVAYAEEAEQIFLRAGAREDVAKVLGRLREKAAGAVAEA